jgi:hypothetical protein
MSSINLLKRHRSYASWKSPVPQGFFIAPPPEFCNIAGIGRTMMTSLFRLSALGGALAGLMLFVSAGVADEKPAPQGSVIVTVGGKIANWNRNGAMTEADAPFKEHKISFEKAMAFDGSTFSGLPMHELRVSTPGGDSTFAGPLLADVLRASGADVGAIKLTARDGSVVDLSVEDVKTKEWILAHLVDGKPVTGGDFGPLWLLHKPGVGETPSKEELLSWVSSVFYIEVL